jgi:arylsulfatase
VIIAAGRPGSAAGPSTPKDGRAKFAYNVLGIREFTRGRRHRHPRPGLHQVRMEFAYDGGGLAKGGDVTLYYDGTAAGTGRVEATQPMIFSADETTDIGYESGTTVTPDYTASTSRFTGRINWVQIDLGDDDTTTSSTPTNACASPWPGSNASPLPGQLAGFCQVLGDIDEFAVEAL